jgi:hypothetical protein
MYIESVRGEGGSDTTHQSGVRSPSRLDILQHDIGHRRCTKLLAVGHDLAVGDDETEKSLGRFDAICIR